MAIQVNVGGVWKDVNSVEVNVGGVWKDVNTLSINVGGTWKDVFPDGYTGTVTLSGETGINDSDTSSPFDSRAGIRINTDGTIDKYKQNSPGAGYTQIDSTTDWIIPNTAANSNFEVYLTVTSGTPDLGDSTGTWLDMSVNRQWLVQKTTFGVKSFNWTLAIRYNGGSQIDSAAYTGQAAAGL